MKPRDILIIAALLALAAAIATKRTPQPSPSEADTHKARVEADRETLRKIRKGTC
jgi:hypothetical protein